MHRRFLPLAPALRTGAVLLFLATAAAWLGTGAHRGWTVTSVVTLQQDEITGLEYPVRHDAFIVGLELLGLGLAGAGVLAGLGQLAHRRAGSSRAAAPSPAEFFSS